MPNKPLSLDIATLLPWANRFHLFRIVLVSMVLTIIALHLSRCGTVSTFHIVLALFGFTYPIVLHQLFGRGAGKGKRRGARIAMLLDGLFAGLAIASVEFATVPSVVMAAINLFNWLAFGGPAIVVYGLLFLGMGLGIGGGLLGFEQGGPVCGLAGSFTYVLLVGYILLVALIVYRYAAALQNKCHELISLRNDAHEGRIRADRAAMLVLPPSVASELSVTSVVTTRKIEGRLLLLVEVCGNQQVTMGIAELSEAFWACNEVMRRHGFECVKTFSRYGLVSGGVHSSVDEAILAARELVAFLRCHLETAPNARSITGVRVFVEFGDVHAGLVQADRLNFDMAGMPVDHLVEAVALIPDVTIALSRNAAARCKQVWRLVSLGKIGQLEWFQLQDADSGA